MLHTIPVADDGRIQTLADGWITPAEMTMVSLDGSTIIVEYRGKRARINRDTGESAERDYLTITRHLRARVTRSVVGDRSTTAGGASDGGDWGGVLSGHVKSALVLGLFVGAPLLFFIWFGWSLFSHPPASYDANSDPYNYEQTVKNAREKMNTGNADQMTEKEKQAAEDFLEWQSGQ